MTLPIAPNASTRPAPLSASEFVALSLRQFILEGKIAAGERIQQHKVAAELGVSHVPLREAIQKLKAEGFITIHPRRGAFVAPLSIDDAREIFELRRALELKALQLSLPTMSPNQVELAQEKCALADGVYDVVRYGQLNMEFHRVIYASARSPRLIEMIERLWLNSSRYSMILRFKGGHFEQSQEEHWKIVDAAITKEVDAACALLDRHIEAAASKIVDLLRSSSAVEGR